MKNRLSNLYEPALHFLSLYTPYEPAISKRTSPFSAELDMLLASMEPPSYYSIKIAINCIKWVSKAETTNRHGLATNMIHDLISKCRKWGGSHAITLIDVYEIAAVYYEQSTYLTNAI